MRHLLSAFFLLTTTLTLHAQPPSYVPTDGLVGWWPFNGNANDESGNGNNGTVNGATLTEDRFGNANSSYLIGQPTNTINFGSSSSLSLIDGEELTISYWLKWDGGTLYSLYKYDNGNPPNSNYAVLGGNGNGYSIATSGNGTGPNTTYTGFNPNEWIHFTVTFQSGANNTKIYINGVLETEGTSNLSSVASTANLAINSAVGIQNYTRGVGHLDDMAIWNRALSISEIQSLYTSQPPPCVSSSPISFNGLSSSYSTTDAPVTLSATPFGGVFLGPGVTGNTFNPAAAGIGTHSIIYTYVDQNNCINSTGLCTSVSLGMGLEPGGMLSGGVKVFPNPNRGQFTVELELSGLGSLQVFDARGALVQNEVFTASGSRTQRTLDLSAFAKGSYTLRVEHNGQRVTQAVVVE
jgi:hypothetical protein